MSIKCIYSSSLNTVTAFNVVNVFVLLSFCHLLLNSPNERNKLTVPILSSICLPSHWYHAMIRHLYNLSSDMNDTHRPMSSIERDAWRIIRQRIVWYALAWEARTLANASPYCHIDLVDRMILIWALVHSFAVFFHLLGLYIMHRPLIGYLIWRRLGGF